MSWRHKDPGKRTRRRAKKDEWGELKILNRIRPTQHLDTSPPVNAKYTRTCQQTHTHPHTTLFGLIPTTLAPSITSSTVITKIDRRDQNGILCLLLRLLSIIMVVIFVLAAIRGHNTTSFSLLMQPQCPCVGVDCHCKHFVLVRQTYPLYSCEVPLKHLFVRV